MGDTDTEGVDDLWCKLPTYDGMALPRFPPIIANVKDHMTAIRSLDTHESDILFCTFPKSGTNWINEIIMMLMRGAPEYNRALKDAGMLELVSTMDAITALPSPRVINTHLPFNFLPKKHVREGYKIIHVMRNPKDVTVSMYCHVSQDSCIQSDQFPGSWDNFLKFVCDNKMKFYGGWFDYIKQFEEETDKGILRNVHTLFYEEMHKNTVSEIQRLAKFLEVDCDDAMALKIQQKCSFNNMFKHYETTGLIKDLTLWSRDGKTNFIMRKGVVGDWKNWFTVAQNERFNTALKKELGESKLTFKYEL